LVARFRFGRLHEAPATTHKLFAVPLIVAPTKRTHEMTTYNFTLIIEGGDLQSAEAQDALYEAGCDDATFGLVDGVQYAEFDREAGSYGQALASAMVGVRRAVPAAKVVHIEPDEFVTMAEIAERLGRSRESIRLLVAGERGSGDFPAPVSHVTTRTRLWRWPEVMRWFATRYEDEYGERLVQVPEDPHVTAMVNGYLMYRKYQASISIEDRKRLEEAAG
jgi:hypothetical protein